MPAANTTCNYDLIAVDLDGTLLSSQGKVCEASRLAIARAKQAGVRVSICTGRGYNECKHFAQVIDQTDPLVVAGGAILADASTGKTLHRFPMRPELVSRLVTCLTEHGHAALILKDPCATSVSGIEPGHDYVIVSPRGMDGIDPISRWWFERHNIRIHVVPSIDCDEHPEHTVRVGICGTRRETSAAAQEWRTQFADEVALHHFGAVAPGDNLKADDDQIVILEAFDRHVNKWTAIEFLAELCEIQPGRIAAIGNDINDIAMLQSAGLGIAMENSIPEALNVARRRTKSNDDAGVAHAIDHILSGHW